MFHGEIEKTRRRISRRTMRALTLRLVVSFQKKDQLTTDGALVFGCVVRQLLVEIFGNVSTDKIRWHASNRALSWSTTAGATFEYS